MRSERKGLSIVPVNSATFPSAHACDTRTIKSILCGLVANLKSCVVCSLVTKLTYFHSSTSPWSFRSAFLLYRNRILLMPIRKPLRPLRHICFLIVIDFPGFAVSISNYFRVSSAMATTSLYSIGLT